MPVQSVSVNQLAFLSKVPFNLIDLSVVGLYYLLGFSLTGVSVIDLSGVGLSVGMSIF